MIATPDTVAAVAEQTGDPPMTDNSKPWRDRITIDPDGRYCLVDGGEFHRLPNAILRHLLAEAHDLAARINGTNQPTEAEVEALADKALAWEAEACRLRRVLADRPTDLPDGASPWLGDEADAVALPAAAYHMDGDEWEALLNGEWHPPSLLSACGTRPVLLRRKPQEPPTVKVPWWEALRDGRTLPCGTICTDTGQPTGSASRWVGRWESASAQVDADGTVEVLA